MGVFDWLFGRQQVATPPAAALRMSERAVRVQTTPPPGAANPCFAIVDVETTGLSPRQDRILELAVVRVDRRGLVVDEWSTRFDPEGPVGATHIHGITQTDVVGAPFFRDVAESLIPYIAGMPLAAHNANFDLAFLRAEFQRAGWAAPWLPAYCTLDGSRDFLPDLDRRRLADCCWAAGVPLDNAHSALGDARATAGLLSFYLNQAGRRQNHTLVSLHEDARRVVWPDGPTHAPFTSFPDDGGSTQRPHPTRITASRPKQPPLLRQLSDLSLLEAIEEGAPEGAIVYLETLLDALEDGEITDEEAGSLADLISVYGLTDLDLRAAHRAFILALAHKAVDDGHVSRDEREELHALSDALDVPADAINKLISQADAARAARMSAGLGPLPEDWGLGEPLRVGDKVAFTGCDDRQRERLERRAELLGVRVMNNVSRLTSMLVTDGFMDGTKLAKAREVGTRIVHPDSFETLLGHLQPALPAEERRQPRAASSRLTPNRSNEIGSSQADAGNVASPGAVRGWALANGYQVGVRGRISSDISDAYARAHASSLPTVREADARVVSFEFQGESMAPLGEWAYAPIVPTQAMALTGGDDMKVVGEARHEEGIERMLATWRDDDEAELLALLVAEPLNPLNSKAVRVDLLVGHARAVCGYLSDEHALTFHDLITSAMDIGALPLMKARASEWTTPEPSIDIWLVHFPADAAPISVTDDLIARTNERRATADRHGG